MFNVHSILNKSNCESNCVQSLYFFVKFSTKSSNTVALQTHIDNTASRGHNMRKCMHSHSEPIHTYLLWPALDAASSMMDLVTVPLHCNHRPDALRLPPAQQHLFLLYSQIISMNRNLEFRRNNFSLPHTIWSHRCLCCNKAATDCHHQTRVEKHLREFVFLLLFLI